jgi:CDP-glycerol glycerophosphotransferase (TagB/SpsB family)
MTGEPAGGRPERYLLYVSETYALGVLRPLARAVAAAGSETAWFFDGPGEEFLRGGERRLASVDAVREFRPSAVFVPGNWVPDFFPGVKVQVFHGFSVGKRSDGRGHFRIRGLFDLYCTQGSSTTPQFKALAARYGHFQVEETGWPKVDPLFWPADPAANPWRSCWDRERPIVLYSSTFTPALSSARPLYDVLRRSAVEGRFNWLVTLHPKMPEEIVRAYRALQGAYLRFVRTDDVVPLLQAADVMVSDTSSILYEFLLQHRPVVTFRTARPGPHLLDVSSADELRGALERALGRPRELMRAIVDVADEIHPYRDGRSSERVLSATRQLVSRGARRLRRKPLNLWRRLRMRHRLGYYHWR